MIEKIYDHNCKMCPLHKTVPPQEWVCVSGSGDYSSRGLILGEAPGKNESERGIPFVGRAGEVLDIALTKAGMARENVFVTNTVKCRPPDNRKPEASEEEICRQYLKRELQIIDPLAILALGNHALRASTGLWGITRYAGLWQEVPRRQKDPLLVMPCFHPAYVLYNRGILELFEETVHQFVYLINS